jgi:sRNA-binding protein
MPEGMDEMKGLENLLFKGAMTLAGFLVVLGAVENLKNTADDIGKRKLEEAKAKASQEAQAREEANKAERDMDALTQRLWEENQKTPIYPAAQPAPQPSETVPLSDAEMKQLNKALANQKGEREKSASDAR